MLALLGTCLLAIFAAGIAWWLIGFATEYIGAKLTQLAHGLVIIFCLVFVIVTLWHGRGALGLG